MKKVFLILLIALNTGCSSKLYTVLNPTIDPNKTNNQIEGLIVYGTQDVIELYKATTYVDEDTGFQTRTSDADDNTKKCIATFSTKYSTRTDYSNKMIMKFDPGFLESYKFGVTLKDGVLISINTESTPQQPAAYLTATAALLPFYKKTKGTKGMVSTDMPECNSGLKAIGVYLADSIKPFSQLDKDRK